MNQLSISTRLLNVCLFVAVLLIALSVAAQPQSSQKRFDSISKVLLKTQAKDSALNLLELQKKIAEESNDKKQLVDVLIKLSTNFNQEEKENIIYLEKAHSLAEELVDSTLITTTSIRLARVYQVRNEYKKALFYADKSIEFSEKLENKKEAIEAYSTRANINNNISQVKDAISDLNTAKKIALQLSDNSTILIPILKTQSYIYYSNGQYEKGLAILDEIISLYEDEDNFRQGTIWRNNKAMIHLSCFCVPVDVQKKNLLHSINNSKKIQFNAGEAFAYVHLARVYKNENQLDSASHYLEVASNIPLGRRAKRFNGYLNQIKGDLWATKNNASKAIQYYKAAYTIWDDLQVLKDKQYTAKHLSHFYNQQNNHKEAYKYLEAYSNIKDSSFSKKSIEEVKELELTYEFEKQQYTDSIQNAKALAILDLKQKNELQQERHVQHILIGLFVIALVFGGFAYYAYQRKKKTSRVLDEKNKIIEKALKEKQLLLKEVHHRVKNNFQIVSSLLELQTKGIEDEKALNLANEGKNRVKSMALIHQKLYQNDTGLIDFEEYIHVLVKELSYMYASDKHVKTHIHSENMQFDIDTAIPLGLIVNELITNAYKYAFDSATDNELNIYINKLNDDEYKLVVSDNGRGIDDTLDLTKVKSLGLRLVRRLTKQLQGNFLWNNHNGATFEIIFKDTQKRALLD